jgi:tetratricopeptide (TPR) repeat protein
MRRFWQVHGHLEEGRRWLERALELPAGPSDANARAWTGLGMLRGEQGDYAGARVAFERSLTLARELDDPRRLVSALNNLGNVAFFLGETEAAEELYGQSLEQSRALGSDHTTAISLENLGCVRLVQGDVDDAVDLLREAVELTRRLGELRAVASTEAWLGRALVLRGDTDGARPLLANSLHVARRLHHRQGVATAIGFTAAYAVARDEGRLAARLAGAVETLWPSTGAAPPPDYRALAERTAAHLRAVLDAGELARETAAGRALDEGAAAALAEETLARP